jgi:two-component system, chemotaxis family, protein-glutamate methylesterase/glutaminase
MDNSEPSGKIRLLVVDDSAFVRKALVRIFTGHPAIQVIDVASDGEMAISLAKRLRPDIVTLDVRMPVLDGLSALERIMAECPVPVIMLSSLTDKGGENTLRALELGAVDYVDKSAIAGPMDISSLAGELTVKILTAAQVDISKLQGMPMGRRETVQEPVDRLRKGSRTEVVLIGSSTGGPQALRLVLGRIPADFPCPILVVQHMTPGFTASLSERLDATCAIKVKEAVDGEDLIPGTAYIAPAGVHLKVGKNGSDMAALLELTPHSSIHRPSVDVLFESASTACGAGCVAFVLTGMGKDGAVGAEAVKREGGRVFVESEETAIVNGMPKAVAEAVEVDGVLPLYDMADAIVKCGTA